jgi:hypothetical protein
MVGPRWERRLARGEPSRGRARNTASPQDRSARREDSRCHCIRGDIVAIATLSAEVRTAIVVKPQAFGSTLPVTGERAPLPVPTRGNHVRRAVPTPRSPSANGGAARRDAMPIDGCRGTLWIILTEREQPYSHCTDQGSGRSLLASASGQPISSMVRCCGVAFTVLSVATMASCRVQIALY